ncbi:hypothetical protein PILCRDRAFT_659649 [Piloderma croceum F 1598]|uniref:Uncharacterized protein n=1 Tax=Piloderma croceum (strain F 1598) TaxID=765440 RepID=A0A0C3F7T2_PILCF|nr:hypothetical protein PILCRDRAFT_659649 [Piloderma croceum F 1598]
MPAVDEIGFFSSHIRHAYLARTLLWLFELSSPDALEPITHATKPPKREQHADPDVERWWRAQYTCSAVGTQLREGHKASGRRREASSGWKVILRGDMDAPR